MEKSSNEPKNKRHQVIKVKTLFKVIFKRYFWIVATLFWLWFFVYIRGYTFAEFIIVIIIATIIPTICAYVIYFTICFIKSFSLKRFLNNLKKVCNRIKKPLERIYNRIKKEPEIFKKYLEKEISKYNEKNN